MEGWNAEDAFEHDQDVGGEEDAKDEGDAGEEERNSQMTLMVQNPHVQELLRKKTSNEKAASRETTKLAQLEKDSITPLYPGCDPARTRLNGTLTLLNIKA